MPYSISPTNRRVTLSIPSHKREVNREICHLILDPSLLS